MVASEFLAQETDKTPDSNKADFNAIKFQFDLQGHTLHHEDLVPSTHLQ